MLELLVGGLLMEQEGQRKVKTNPGINSFHNWVMGSHLATKEGPGLEGFITVMPLAPEPVSYANGSQYPDVFVAHVEVFEV